MALALTLNLRSDCFEGIRITPRVAGSVYDLIFIHVNGETAHPYFYFRLLNKERKEVLSTRVSTRRETRQLLERPILGLSFSNHRGCVLTPDGIAAPFAFSDPTQAYNLDRSTYDFDLTFIATLPRYHP